MTIDQELLRRREKKKVASDDDDAEDCEDFLKTWQAKAAIALRGRQKEETRSPEPKKNDDEKETVSFSRRDHSDWARTLARDRRQDILSVVQSREDSNASHASRDIFGSATVQPRGDATLRLESEVLRLGIDDKVLAPQRPCAINYSFDENDNALVAKQKQPHACICGFALADDQDDAHLRTCGLFRDTWESAMRKFIDRQGLERVKSLVKQVTDTNLVTDDAMSFAALTESRGDLHETIRKLRSYEYRRDMYLITHIHDINAFLFPDDDNSLNNTHTTTTALLRTAALQWTSPSDRLSPAAAAA